MKIPNNDIPPDMNWADYCDALNNERFLRKITIERHPRTRSTMQACRRTNKPTSLMFRRFPSGDCWRALGRAGLLDIQDVRWRLFKSSPTILLKSG
jgi:hypothetical protein